MLTACLIILAGFALLAIAFAWLLATAVQMAEDLSDDEAHSHNLIPSSPSPGARRGLKINHERN